METKEIENKWQRIWKDNNAFKAEDNSSKKKFYGLVEFPYPSGIGMHVGHVKAYSGLEVIARKRRLEGYNVLFPIGFDAYGLPTENYAIKTKTHPRIVTDNNIKNYTDQLKRVGYSFDWDRVIDTTDESYYKWTQWIFLKMFEKGLAFKDKTYVNYCPSCKVVLSNEDSQGGKCDICHNDVVQKEKDVWYLKITDYADRLLSGLDKIDYLPNIKLQQQNWIGKSTGAYVNFKLNGSNELLKVYTTRPDTLFGVTFMVIAPEHPLIDKNKNSINNMSEINEYREYAKKKTEFERIQLAKDKTGVKLEGISAINPVNNKEIPIYISDYVMMNYGTGAIMAVPAHDDRDYAFAIKFNIPIVPVIEQITGKKQENEFKKNSIVAVLHDSKTGKYLTLNWKNNGGRLFIGGSIEKDEGIEECARREIVEETGYTDFSLVSKTFPINHHYFAYNKNKCYEIEAVGLLYELNSDEKMEQKLDTDEMFVIEWIDEKILAEITDELHYTVYENLKNPKPYAGSGKIVNSEFLNGLTDKKEAIDMMINYLKEHDLGQEAVQYKMQDWAFNRQRYWGEPIPIIYCPKCGMLPVPYDELPLKLPEIENFEPGTNGESPLAKIEDFVNCKCPKCGEDAKRETDTMPQWAGSSWYFLRYIDPHNDKELASLDKLKYWMGVDWYNGGMEHVTRHVIYSRFWYKFLYDIGVVSTDEPYMKRTAQGLVLGPDGEKMSKSRGNVINPNDIVDKLGADTLRAYVLFMGDYGLESPWNDDSIKGISRFLEKIEALKNKVEPLDKYSEDIEIIINKTIKKVSDDYESMKFNTAIAELMKLVNIFNDKDRITKKDYHTLLTLLYPVSPHITEELNEQIGYTPLYKATWPIVDEDKLIEQEKEIAVQVNGKLRATIKININDTEEQIKEQALAEENVKKHIEEKEIVKIIIIKDKIVNIVIK